MVKLMSIDESKTSINQPTKNPETNGYLDIGLNIEKRCSYSNSAHVSSGTIKETWKGSNLLTTPADWSTMSTHQKKVSHVHRKQRPSTCFLSLRYLYSPGPQGFRGDIQCLSAKLTNKTQEFDAKNTNTYSNTKKHNDIVLLVHLYHGKKRPNHHNKHFQLIHHW